MRIQAAPEEPVVPLALPEGLTEAQWNAAILAETGQTAAEDIVDNIVNSAVDQYHEHIVSSLAQPFVATRAKEMLQYMVESGYIEHDAGEPAIASDPLWAPGDGAFPCASNNMHVELCMQMQMPICTHM